MINPASKCISLTRVWFLSLALLPVACGGDIIDNRPIANAGPDQSSNVFVGDAVVLDGSASSDADGDTLTYEWTLATVPPNSTAALSDPLSDKPTFIADKTGTYTAVLVVNDGIVDSFPDSVNVMVVIPPPTVTIDTPEPLSVATGNPVTVAGTVDDPQAAITVNGDATPNNNGSYSADVILAEGSNTVTVIATNSSGEGNASVEVFLQTLPGPVMNITSHRNGFTEGTTWDGQGSAPVAIPAVVQGTITTQNGPPTVTVNGEQAEITSFATNPLLVEYCNLFPNAIICTSLDDTRYSFSATIQLSKGPQTITAEGIDTVGGTTTVAVSGVADYCHIGAEDPGVGAERDNGQSNQCIEIDGCSVYLYENGPLAVLDFRNNPMPLADKNLVPIDFGSGTVPPSEFLVYGEGPQRALGCNIHDICYQSCVPEAQWGQAKADCDREMYGNHLALCRRAYPAECPFTGLESFKCVDWLVEKATCFDWALTYYSGVTLFGTGVFEERQTQHCLVP